VKAVLILHCRFETSLSNELGRSDFSLFFKQEWKKKRDVDEGCTYAISKLHSLGQEVRKRNYSKLLT
jgi:hypothetical protein